MMNRVLTWIIALFLTVSLAACSNHDPVQGMETQDDSYVYPGELTARVKDRSFTLEDTPGNPAEGLIAFHYYDNINGDYNHYQSAVGDNESLQICAENERKNFEKGCYVKDYRIHELSTLSEEEITSLFGESIAEEASKYQLNAYEVVVADFDLTWSEEALSGGPQLGNGRYSRLFLCGTTPSEAAWKIYELYWGEGFGR